ncbi:MAG: hypothetical protein ACRELY_25160 [Polyangiaceae bacterium]
MKLVRLSTPIVALALVASSFPTRTANAAEDAAAAACASAYEKAQYLRRDKKLRAAHKELLVCSQATCPAAVVSDCTQWLSEVEKGTPTVVFDARDPKGQSVADVKVYMDGELMQNKLDGTAVQVDPGTHTFRFEPAVGTAGEQQVLVLEGEKTRVITFALTGVPAPGGNPGGGQSNGNQGGGTEQPSPGSAQKTIGIAVAGVGVVALGAGIIFGAMGSSQASSDKNAGGCAPNCSDDEVSSIKTKLIMSDIFIPVGVVAVAAGVVLYLTAGGSSKAAATTGSNHIHFDAAPTRGGASFGLGGSF